MTRLRLIALALVLSACTRKVQVGVGDTLVTSGPNINALALSDDGSRILLGREDGSVAFLEIASRKIDHVIKGRDIPPPPVMGVGFLPLGRTCVVTKDGRVSVLEAGTDTLVGKVDTSLAKNASAVVVQRPSTVVLGVKGGTVRVVGLDPLQPGAAPFVFDKGSKVDPAILAIGVAPDGNTMLVATNQPAIRSFDVHSGTPITSWTDALFEGNAITFAPDGRVAVIGSSKGDLWWLDVGTHKWLRTIEARHTASVSALAISADDGIGVSGDTRGGIAIWDPKNGAELGKTSAPGAIDGLALSPDGTALYAAAEGGTVSRFEITRH